MAYEAYEPERFAPTLVIEADELPALIQSLADLNFRAVSLILTRLAGAFAELAEMHALARPDFAAGLLQAARMTTELRSIFETKRPT